MAKWSMLKCNKAELDLCRILTNGQSFRWKNEAHNSWISVLQGKVWLLKQDENNILYKVYENGHGLTKTDGKPKIYSQSRKQQEKRGNSNHSIRNLKKLVEVKTEKVKCELSSKIKEDNIGVAKYPAELTLNDDCTEVKFSETRHFKDIQKYDETENEMILRDYFQLDISLCDLYKEWSDKDPHFKHTSQKYHGLRLLRQDPVENLFSFICSSNNNISRISSMVEAMCKHHGEKVAIVDGVSYHAFPTVQALAGPGVEQTLRNLKFGYRAHYISETAKYLTKFKDLWLYELREKSYSEVWNELIKMTGVGPKVADCICLMSMDKPAATPVDTHIFQLALRDYSKYPQISKHKGAKSVTPKLYKDIGDFFRGLWGDYAGWAQSVLFTAELPQFKEKKTETLKVLKRKGSQLKNTNRSPSKRKKKTVS